MRLQRRPTPRRTGWPSHEQEKGRSRTAERTARRLAEGQATQEEESWQAQAQSYLKPKATMPTGLKNLYLSKSKYLWGLQCHKLLWHAYNAKDLIPERDAATQAIFDQGHEVGALAKQIFP